MKEHDDKSWTSFLSTDKSSFWLEPRLPCQPFTQTNIGYASSKSNESRSTIRPLLLQLPVAAFRFALARLRRSQNPRVSGRDRVINRPKGGSPKRGGFRGSGHARLSAATRAKLVFKAVIIYRGTVSRDSQLHIRFRSRFSLFSFLFVSARIGWLWTLGARMHVLPGDQSLATRRANSRDGTKYNACLRVLLKGSGMISNFARMVICI